MTSNPPGAFLYNRGPVKEINVSRVPVTTLYRTCEHMRLPIQRLMAILRNFGVSASSFGIEWCRTDIVWQMGKGPNTKA